ncbi:MULTISPECIES: ADP-ribosyltransferase [unclassified Vibrio]|uniref:ADP-ribosyltransferase n=1 Tax=unclassified Vibrio TaxID=2614977 RepID=UPI000C847A6B|nr:MULTISPECIES: ADP-ribosyltransferase [unclassified Vibrio]PMI91321.1 hypothetical protein BCU34_21825 [Vibrio sp. 10N.286.45.E10]PTQ19037.1 hypothetical protein CWO24_23455 [Vibrio sp. 10N.286.46.E10]
MHRVIGRERYEQVAAELGIQEAELYTTQSNLYIAIRNYTYRRFEDINELIRSGDTNEKHQIAVSLLIQALESLPIHENDLVVRWTDLTPEHLALIRVPGSIIYEPSFTSTSQDPGFFIEGCAHRLVIIHVNGRHIAPWSYYCEEEDEVLIPPRSTFRSLGYNDEYQSFVLQQLTDEEVEQLPEQAELANADLEAEQQFVGGEV